MSRKRRQRSKRFAASGFTRQSARRTRFAKRREESVAKSATGPLSRHPMVAFLVIFGVLMGLFYAFAIFTPYYKRDFLLSYLPFNARVSGAILSFLGHDITVSGASVFSPAFSLRVVPGCDGIEPIALFVCAVLAFPARFVRKIPGIIAGTLLLAALNFVRVVSLFLIGVYWPSAFTVAHLEVWQALFIVFAVVFWILWLLWATQSQTRTQRVPS
ncbi:MAG: exosortase H [Phycisphaerales bacterium]|nr:MAG: exosortase H [Phycisphaerales bacterium]